jgi:hypothetical protein
VNFKRIKHCCTKVNTRVPFSWTAPGKNVAKPFVLDSMCEYCIFKYNATQIQYNIWKENMFWRIILCRYQNVTICLKFQLLNLWTLSIVLFSFRSQNASETEFFSVFRWNLLSGTRLWKWRRLVPPKLPSTCNFYFFFSFEYHYKCENVIEYEQELIIY